ncbi:hypothetical protein Aab01nite_61330 [Paractinoplanes abujensis]|nr:hypothetical protein Aab01nite_61330 [Actinoplanes abujensis]
MRLHPRSLYVPLPAPVIARHSKTASMYVVRDGSGHVVGRTSTYRFGPCQLFGHTEFTDDDTVFGALMQVVTGAAAGRPLFGPVSLLPNQSGGVITSGFESRGFVDSAWNPAYYPAMYERHGFTRRFEADTWAIDVAGSAGAYTFDDNRIAAERLVIRHGTRRGLRHQLPVLREMLNASFAQLGYYTEISAAQLAEQTDGLAYLLDEGLLVWLEKAGRPVAFLVAVPDISEFLMRTGGRLGPLDQLRLLATRARYRRDAVLVIKGVVPSAQGQGYMTLLSREVHRHLEASGYRTLRSTFVERDNTASAASYRRAGGRPLHGYTFYQRGAA